MLATVAVALATGGGLAAAPAAAVETPAAVGDAPAAFTHVAMADSQAFAVRADGAILAWGTDNSNGELGLGTTGLEPWPKLVQRGAIPEGVTIVQIETGNQHTAALGDDGKVYGWGSNANSQLGDGTTTHRLAPVAVAQGAIPAGVKIVQIATSWLGSYGLGDNGKVYAWGGSSALIGDGGPAGPRSTPVAVAQGQVPDGVKLVGISANSASLALGDDGKAYAWGENSGGQLGIGTRTPAPTPVAVDQGQIPAGVKLVRVSAGSSASYALGDDGKAYSWGTNSHGELGNGTNGSTRGSLTPVAVLQGQIPASVKLVAMAHPSDAAIALGDDGKLYAWGKNSPPQLGDGTTTSRTTPVAVLQGEIPDGVKITAVSSQSARSAAALGDNGKVYGWSYNNTNQLLDGTAEERTSPIELDIVDGPRAPMTTTSEVVLVTGTPMDGEPLTVRVHVRANWAAGSVELRDGETVLGTATNANGVALITTDDLAAGEHALTAVFTPTVPEWFAPSTSAPFPITIAVRPPAVATNTVLDVTGTQVTGNELTLKAAVTPAAAGSVEFRDGETALGSAAVANGVATLKTAALTAGEHSLTAVFIPTQPRDFIASTSAPVEVNMRPGTGTVLTVTGARVVGGQLTLTATVTPAEVPGAVEFRYGETVLGSDETEAGVASITTAGVPVGTHFLTAVFTPADPDAYVGSTSPAAAVTITWPLPDDDSAFTVMSRGSMHGLAVRGDGALFAWGRNVDGQLGDGTTTSALTPVQVQRGEIPEGVTIVHVTAGETHSLALGDNGKVYAWGRNADGQLGDGTKTQRTAPVAVVQGAIPAGVKIVKVVVGSRSSYAVGDNGWVYSWGDNTSRMLGNNLTADSAEPVAIVPGVIPAGVKLVDVARGSYHAMVLGDDGKVYAWGSNAANGQLGSAASTSATPIAAEQGQIPAGVKLVRIAAGTTNSWALGEDGKVYAWGGGGYGALGNGTNPSAQQTPVAVSQGEIPAGVRIVDLGPMDEAVIALGDNGKAYSWGRSNDGRLGNGVTSGTFLTPVAVVQGALADGVKLVALSSAFSTTGSGALGQNGKVYAWGANNYGQLGNGGTVVRPAPTEVVFDPSSIELQQTTTTMSTSGTLVEGAPFTVTATVAPASATGMVRFRVPATNTTLGTAQVVGGLAQLTVTRNVVGSEEYVAEYIPDQPLYFAASASEPYTAVFAASPRPKITASSTQVATTAGTNENELTLTLTDADTPVQDVAVTVTSASPQITPDEVTITGTGATRTVQVNPAQRVDGVSLTFTAADPQGNAASVSVQYYVSLPTPSPTARYYYGDSDASAAVDAGDGYIIVADDEHEVLKLYKAGESGYPVREFSFSASIPGGEIDIESAARVGDTIYWVGSHGNARDGDSKPERKTVFTTTVTGSGAATVLTVGSIMTPDKGLVSSLVNWDSSNGHGLGADRLKFRTGTQRGELPNPPSGFNIEGFAFAPGSTSIAYLGFRAPSITFAGTERALIVPVNNFDALVAGTTTQPEFGAPILPDLGGRTIRDMRKNSHDEYLITAGPIGNQDWALYTWNGDPNTAPVLNRTLPTIDGSIGGAWEVVATVPDPLVAGAQVELIADNGDAPLYGGDAAKDLARPLRKAYADTFTLAALPDTTAPTVTVKDGSSFTIGSGGVYSKVSFKLFDAGKIDRVVINGVVKDLSDSAWGDVDFVKPGVFGAVVGVNTLEVYDVAGNRTTIEFTLDGTAPTVTVKDGSSFTVGSGGLYQKVSFKLFDAGKIDQVVINGKVKDLSNSAWSDVDFIKPGVFGAVEGVNTLEVYDVAGNVTTVRFTLDTTAPTVTVKEGDRYTIGGNGVYEKVSFKLFDAGKIDNVVINGRVKDLADNTSSNLDFVRVGAFGAVEGQNVMEVYDVVGNRTTIEFTLDT